MQDNQKIAKLVQTIANMFQTHCHFTTLIHQRAARTVALCQDPVWTGRLIWK